MIKSGLLYFKNFILLFYLFYLFIIYFLFHDIDFIAFINFLQSRILRVLRVLCVPCVLRPSPLRRHPVLNWETLEAPNRTSLAFFCFFFSSRSFFASFFRLLFFLEIFRHCVTRRSRVPVHRVYIHDSPV